MRQLSVLTAVIEPTIAAPPAVAARQARPTDVDVSFALEGLCDFAIRFHFTGKTKTIDLPRERSTATGPGAIATLTNLDNEHQVTFGITGAFHRDTQPNGETFNSTLWPDSYSLLAGSPGPSTRRGIASSL